MAAAASDARRRPVPGHPLPMTAPRPRGAPQRLAASPVPWPAEAARLVEDTARRHCAGAQLAGLPAGPEGAPAAGVEAAGRERRRPAQHVEVEVLRLVSPLDTGSIHGRGHGLLRADPSVAVTFVVEQSEFAEIRRRLLDHDGDVFVTVDVADVTAIDVAGSRETTS